MSKIHFIEYDSPIARSEGISPLLDHEEFIRSGHTISNVMDADFIININNHSVNGPNVILVSMEPPCSGRWLRGGKFYDHVFSCYMNPHLFHSVFRFGPCDSNKGEFPVTEDPIAFPYHPHGSGEDTVRADTTMRDRRVFFAGLARFTEVQDVLGRVGLYSVRSKLVSDLRDHGISVYAEGPGFGRDSREEGRIDRWDLIKLDLCRRVQADFHLCAENCQFENYISEKIHHGFQSDLVVLYLGNADICKYVPPEAFVNLNEYLDPVKRIINVAAVVDRLKTMTQREYDDILYAAREWRKTSRLSERYAEQVKRLTRVVLKRIKESE